MLPSVTKDDGTFKDEGRTTKTGRKRRADTSLSSFTGEHQQQHDHDETNARGCAGVSSPANPEQGETDTAENDQDALSESQHRSLVEAIFDAGLKHASPAVIMEKMDIASDEVTSERVKSHLQKYRNNKEKNNDEFMQEYDDWMRKAKSVESSTGIPGRNVAIQNETALMSGPPERYHGGERAAYLTYSVLQEQREAPASASQQPDKSAARAPRSHETIVTTPHDGQALTFPILTEEEKATPLGESISKVMSIFDPVVQYVMSEREKKNKAQDQAEETMPATSSHTALEARQQLASQQASSRSNSLSTATSPPPKPKQP